MSAGGDYLAAGIAAAAWVTLALLLASGGHDHDAMYAHVLSFLGMWSLMVVAMMVPTTWAGLRTHGLSSMRDVGQAAFANVAVWGAFGLVALTIDRLVSAALTPAAVLVVAGLFQLSAVKRRLLSSARLSRGAWRHAVSCVGSCWALMLVMFAVGMGSVALMAALTVVMVAERLGRGGDRVAALAGVGLLVAAVPVALGW